MLILGFKQRFRKELEIKRKGTIKTIQPNVRTRSIVMQGIVYYFIHFFYYICVLGAHRFAASSAFPKHCIKRSDFLNAISSEEHIFIIFFFICFISRFLSTIIYLIAFQVTKFQLFRN